MASSSTAPPPPPKPVQLTRPLMESFKPAKIFQGTKDQGHTVASMAFDPQGETLLTCGSDHTLQLYSCKTGKVVGHVYSKKYGIDHVRHLPNKAHILHASTKENDDIRQMAIETSEYVQYFQGHTARVLSLQTNPTDDTFISSAMDNTVRLWDMRAKACSGKLDAGREPIVAFDNTGKVFAVAHNNDRRDAIHLFDSKQYEGGSFDSFALIDPELAGSQRQVPLLTSLSFSPDGKMLLVGTADSVHYVLDAFDGHLLRRLRDFVGLGVIDANGKLLLKKERNGSGQEVCWSPDGRYVVSGSAKGQVVVWDVIEKPEKGGQPPVLPGGPEWFHCDPILKRDASNGKKAVRAVAFNPRNALLATGSDTLGMWMPERDKMEAAREP